MLLNGPITLVGGVCGKLKSYPWAYLGSGSHSGPGQLGTGPLGPGHHFKFIHLRPTMIFQLLSERIRNGCGHMLPCVVGLGLAGMEKQFRRSHQIVVVVVGFLNRWVS